MNDHDSNDAYSIIESATKRYNDDVNRTVSSLCQIKKILETFTPQKELSKVAKQLFNESCVELMEDISSLLYIDVDE